MPVKDLYYEKYIKYKNKYLNLQKQLGGVLPIKPVRQHSKVITCQGKEETCWAHAITRLIIKLLKNRFTEYFSIHIEECNYYYNTTFCNSTDININIFDCFLDIKLNKYTCDENEGNLIENTWLEENFSALLFNFIFKILIKQFGRGKSNNITANCFYILNYLKVTIITKKLIKRTLVYKNKYTKKKHKYFMFLIYKLVTLFSDIKKQLNTEIFYPICYIIDYNGLFSINEPWDTQSNEYNSIVLHHNLKKNIGTDDALITLKYVLDKGFYALFYTNNHVIIITDYIVKDDDVFLNIKNSWGVNYCKEQQKKWCNIIIDNQINATELFNSMNMTVYYNDLFILFYYPIDYTYISSNSIIDESYLSNKNIKNILSLLNKSILTNLKITNSKFEIDDFNTLNEILKENIKLEELTLNNCNIGDEELKAFVDTLKTNTDIKLEKLDLGNNRLADNFYNNNISDEGAIALANLLQTNRTIRWIDFCNNNITNKGLKALADAVKTNSKVITLDLFDNNISDEELKRLENALKKNVATQNWYHF